MIRADVLIFAKFPQAGQVKTRMVPPLSFEQAADLHRASLLASWELAGGLADVRIILVGTPDTELDEFASLIRVGVDQCWPQGEGTLGERLDRAVERAFTSGAERVVLLGADSPTLPSHRLIEAIDALDDHEAVLGPCDDGGYYLLALSRPQPDLFNGIDWSTHAVAEQTKDRARASGIRLAKLAPWYDLDRFEDLARAASDLAEVDGSTNPAARKLLEVIDHIRQDQPR